MRYPYVLAALLTLASRPAMAGEAGGASDGSTSTPNPTATATPTATPTPTATSTSTATPNPTATSQLDDLGEEITVTVTRAPRRTRDVPQSVAVVGKERLADSITFNVKDVVAGTPGVLVETKNGGYDSRLLIRGAGLKANYGVREIMVLRDGVPLTDPDSLTRLDFVDMQDIERIEISKGPGSLYAPGSAGGAIQIISRSVFDPGADDARAAFGTFGAANAHLRTSSALGESSALALTASFRAQENEWRLWNEFDSKQVSLKHGLQLEGGGTFESEVAYTQANIQLPGAMDRTLFDAFRSTGKQLATSEPWHHSGRYSKIVYANTKLERDVGTFRLKPRAYYTQWSHLHPVTGAINETGAWTRNLGTDLEAQHQHGLGRAEGTLVFGVTAKRQWNDDVRKYQYRDVQVDATGRIVATLSDAKGARLEQQSQWNLLTGAFVQESVRLGPVLLDAGFRFDQSRTHLDTRQAGRFDYASGRYVADERRLLTSKTFDLPAPRVGLTVRVLEPLSVYASFAQASQVPSDSEISTNRELEPARSRSVEVGLKARSPRFSLDAAVFRNRVTNEIVQKLVDRQSTFENAGETAKLGAEVSAAVQLVPGLDLGAGYAWSDFTFRSYSELVRGVSIDRSGNRLPYVPQHQWSAFASWKGPAGFRARVQANTWGRYWLDAANTETYRGYAFLTNVGVGWTHGGHELLLDAQNVLDDHYAMAVAKDANGRVTYTAGTPRSVMLGYRLAFGGGRP